MIIVAVAAVPPCRIWQVVARGNLILLASVEPTIIKVALAPFAGTTRLEGASRVVLLMTMPPSNAAKDEPVFASPWLESSPWLTRTIHRRLPASTTHSTTSTLFNAPP